MQNYNPIITANFEKELKALRKKYPNIGKDVAKLNSSLKKDPITGNKPIGKDLYKVRMAISDKNQGKSGGARVIIQVKVIESIVYLLAIYDKSVEENRADTELAKILKKEGLD